MEVNTQFYCLMVLKKREHLKYAPFNPCKQDSKCYNIMYWAASELNFLPNKKAKIFSAHRNHSNFFGSQKIRARRKLRGSDLASTVLFFFFFFIILDEQSLDFCLSKSNLLLSYVASSLHLKLCLRGTHITYSSSARSRRIECFCNSRDPAVLKKTVFPFQ